MLATLVAAFEASHPGVTLRAVTGGTGEIMEYARRGDVDVIITHDAAAESAFVAQGHGRERRPLMYNQFILAGPASDPAGIRTATDAAEVFRRIANGSASFVSRGDDSGTHRRERAIWKEVSLEPRGQGWYIEAGSGMGDALRLASNRGAYIMTDEATFRTLNDQLELELLFQGDTIRLLNRYGVIVVREPRRPAESDSLLEWLTDSRGRQVIERFGVEKSGRSLFFPIGELRR